MAPQNGFFMSNWDEIVLDKKHQLHQPSIGVRHSHQESIGQACRTWIDDVEVDWCHRRPPVKSNLHLLKVSPAATRYPFHEFWNWFTVQDQDFMIVPTAAQRIMAHKPEEKNINWTLSGLVTVKARRTIEKNKEFLLLMCQNILEICFLKNTNFLKKLIDIMAPAPTTVAKICLFSRHPAPNHFRISWSFVVRW